METQRWCNRIIYIGFILLFALVPLLLTPWNYELFEYNKMMAVYALTVIIVGAWGIKMVKNGEVRIAKTPLDIPILLFFSSQLLSSLFSIDPHVSWFGYYSRFNGGMLSVICYILLYYAFVSNWGEEWRIKNKEWKDGSKKNQQFPILHSLFSILKLALASAALVALYGVAERMGIDKHLWVQDVQNRVFSTLGQPNWLAAYIVALMPLGMAFGLTRIKNIELKMEKDIKYWLTISLFIILNSLFFSVLLFTRSRSGLLGFAVADVIFWITMFLAGFPRQSPTLDIKGVKKNPVGHILKPSSSLYVFFTFLILHSLFFIIIFFNGTHVDSIDTWATYQGWKSRLLSNTTQSHPAEATPSGTLLETGGTESGTIRKYVWEGAISAWRSSKKATLIGTGTETFAFAFFRYKSVGHNLTSEWDFLYNKAHNEYLNYLATTGIFGLGSYLLFIGVFIIWFFIHNGFLALWLYGRNKQNNYASIQPSNHLTIALFAGWVSILITNFFGFAVVVSNLFLFLFPAMIIALTQSSLVPSTAEGNRQTQISFQINRSIHRFLYLTILLVSLALLALLSMFWYADTLFASGYRYAHAGQFSAAYPLMTQAITLNDNEPLYHDENAALLAGLAGEALQNKEATIGAKLVTESLKESDRALTMSPQNVNFWKTRTKIYYAFANADPLWNKAAIEALTKASELAPTDPKIFYNLAILYGRQSDNKKAIELLQKTIILKPNYRDATYALWVFYTETKQAKLAKEVLQTYLDKVDPGDKDFLERIK